MLNKAYNVFFGIFTAIGAAIMAVGVILYFSLGSAAGQLQNSDGTDSGIYLNLFLLLLFGGIGLIFFLSGAIGLLRIRRKSKLKQRLRETGQAIYAEIVSVEQIRNVVINGRSPYLILAQYVDDSTKTIYEFKSEYIREFPSYAKKGESVRIFIDRENKKKYFMDINSLNGINGYTVESL